MNYFTSLKGLSTDLAQSCVKAIKATKFKTNLAYPNDNEINTWIPHLPQSPKYLVNQASLQKSILVRRRSCAWHFIDINKTLNNHNSSFFFLSLFLSFFYLLLSPISNLHLLNRLLNLHLNTKHPIFKPAW